MLGKRAARSFWSGTFMVEVEVCLMGCTGWEEKRNARGSQSVGGWFNTTIVTIGVSILINLVRTRTALLLFACGWGSGRAA